MPGSQVVIDASIALRWLLPDPLSNACWALFDRLVQRNDQITVPTLWMYEVVSGLTKAVHLGVVTPDEARQALEQIQLFRADLADADETLSRRAFEWALRLKRVAAFDSYYLALAEALNCPLWTADRRLYNSSHAAQVGWICWVEDLQS
jgi:predicted nucleic acid-binding protein